MVKRTFLIGALCIGLMAIWGSKANAYPTRLGGGAWTPKCVLFTSEWLGAANTEQRPTDYEATLIPKSLTVLFRNPGDNLGGSSSVNFSNPGLGVTGANTLNPAELTGKGKITDQLTFGDCPGPDNPTRECQEGDNGLLWLLWAEESGCDFDTELVQINCVKQYLTEMYAPNPQWWPYAIKIKVFDAILEAFTDVDKDGNLEEVVHVDYHDCSLNAAEDEYICSPVESWGYKNNDPCGYSASIFNDILVTSSHEEVCP